MSGLWDILRRTDGQTKKGDYYGPYWVKAGSKMPDSETCAMVYNLNSSSHQHQKLWLSLLKFGFSLPQGNNLASYKRHYSLKSYPIQRRQPVTSKMLSQTVSSLLSVCDLGGSSITLFISSKFGLGAIKSDIRKQISKMFLATHLQVIVYHLWSQQDCINSY